MSYTYFPICTVSCRNSSNLQSSMLSQYQFNQPQMCLVMMWTSFLLVNFISIIFTRGKSRCLCSYCPEVQDKTTRQQFMRAGTTHLPPFVFQILSDSFITPEFQFLFDCQFTSSLSSVLIIFIKQELIWFFRKEREARKQERDGQ